jgi:DNA-binding GntR family transcriptional regulator
MALVVPSVIDVLVDAIRKEILDGTIPSGTLLTEMGVASKYAVARPSAKGALERLSHEGLLRRDTNRSARVRALTEDDVRDLYDSRAFIERQVVSTLASKGHRTPDSVRSKLEQMVDTADSGHSVLEFVEADGAFHGALIDALDSPRLSRMHSQLMRETQLCKVQVQFSHLQDPAVIIAEHLEILNAIDDGQPQRAAARMEKHLAKACERLVASL